MTMRKGTTVTFWNRTVKPMGERSHADFRAAVAADKRPVDLARHGSVWWVRKLVAARKVVA